jgi:hypothetical protein
MIDSMADGYKFRKSAVANTQTDLDFDFSLGHVWGGSTFREAGKPSIIFVYNGAD